MNLLDMSMKWKKSPICEFFFEGRDRKTDEVAVKWKATSVEVMNLDRFDLVG